PDPFAVLAVDDVFHPPGVLEIPLHCLSQAGGKRLLGCPAQLALNLAAVYRIASIVPGPVLYICNQPAVRRSLRLQLIQRAAKYVYDVYVLLLVQPANVVGLTGAAAGQYRQDCFAM